MITVKVHQNFLLSLLTQGRVTNALRVRDGLPEGCILVGCRMSSEGYALLDFIDGKNERREMDVVFDVAMK